MTAQPSILIVEDDQELRRMYRHALVLAGFNVREAACNIRLLADGPSQIPCARPPLVSPHAAPASPSPASRSATVPEW